MDENTKTLLLEAAAVGYDLGSSVGEAGTTLTNFSTGSGFYLIRTFVSDETGFKVAFFRRPGTDQCIMSFAGTEELQDAYADMNLGLNQFNYLGSGQSLTEYFGDLLKGAPNIDVSFTGCSIGGALAQYAAFEFASIAHGRNSAQYSPGINLFTIKGIGGVAGTKQQSDLQEEFERIISHTDMANYRTEADIVSRLGGGHLGGAFNCGARTRRRRTMHHHVLALPIGAIR